MALDYTDVLAGVIDALNEVGIPMVVQRLNGTTYGQVGKGSGLFTADKQANETSSRSALLASTAIRTREVLLSPSFKDVRVNDRLIADKATYTVTSVETIRPTTTTLAYRCEVT